MKTFEILVSGKVQGVGFRYFVQTLAIKYSILGTAKNLDNGDVLIFAEGSIDSLEKFINEVSKGTRFAKVENFTKKEIGNTSNFKKFKITY